MMPVSSVSFSEVGGTSARGLLRAVAGGGRGGLGGRVGRLGALARAGEAGAVGPGTLGEQVLLPLRQRLVGADTGLRLVLALGATRTLRALHQTVGRGTGDHLGEQRGRADGVVIARDREVDLV